MALGHGFHHGRREIGPGTNGVLARGGGLCGDHGQDIGRQIGTGFDPTRYLDSR